MFYLLIAFRSEYFYTYSNFFALNLSSFDGKSVSGNIPYHRYKYSQTCSRGHLY